MTLIRTELFVEKKKGCFSTSQEFRLRRITLQLLVCFLQTKHGLSKTELIVPG